MGKRDITLAATLAPFAAMGIGATDQAAAQSDASYEPVGIAAGGFRFFPELELSVEYNDNVLAADDNDGDPLSPEAQSDYLYQLMGSGRLASDWNSHELNVFGEVTSRMYADFDEQNATDARVGADGRLDIDRNFNFNGSASYGSLTEPLSQSPATEQLAEPVKYSRAGASVGVVKGFNQLSISGKVGVDVFDYEDGVRLVPNPTTEFDQDFRDRTISTYGVRGDYNISPATSLFVSYTGNTREFDIGPPQTNVDRSSNGYDALVGVKFEATNLIRGEIGVGYLSQEYEALDTQNNPIEASGLAVRAAVNWQPDELVEVSVAAERGVRDSGTIEAVAYVANDFSVGVEYAFRRNIDIGAEVRYSRDEYEVVDREDERLSYGAHIDYALNRTAALFVAAGHDQQDSNGALNVAGREFTVNRVSFGIKLRR